MQLDEGKHPTREKKSIRATSYGGRDHSFEVIARSWLEMKSPSLNQKYATQTSARMEQHIFPQIGVMPITDITIPDMVRITESIAAGGTIEIARRMHPE